MRKTLEDFYSLYTTKFRPFIFKEAYGVKNVNAFLSRKDMAAWFDYMLCVVATYGELIGWNRDYKRLPADSCGYPTLESILNACSDDMTRRLLVETRTNFERGLVEVLANAGFSPNDYFCKLFRVWFREMLSLRFDLNDTELDDFVKICMEMKQ
ncbi:MAG: hypothetical protein IIW01_08220 [Thermoguttaceae bacterium]|nr:hypothetical protein [Thermoguttaceae bacterium]MBQ5790261.1 hypothetical protein [Thermoguttaceae bacterium]